jgi:hypothetical protein
MAASKLSFDPDGAYVAAAGGLSSDYGETPVAQQSSITQVSAVLAGTTGSLSSTVASLQSQSLANASAINSILTVLGNRGDIAT